jgi:hypothetical protein
VEARSNTSTVALRVVGDEGKVTQYLGLQPGHPVPGGYKYGDLAIQVWGSLESEIENIVISPAGLGAENDCVDESQQQL